METDVDWPTREDYDARRLFFESCRQNFIYSSLKPTNGVVRTRYAYTREAPERLVNLYFTNVPIIRSELRPDVAATARHRIDRHKIAAGYVCAILDIMPIRRIGVNEIDMEVNAAFCIFVVEAHFRKWHDGRFAVSDVAYAFAREHRRFLEHCPGHEIPRQLLAQTYYLLEQECFASMRLTVSRVADASPP